MKKYVALFVLGIGSAFFVPLIIEIIEAGGIREKSVADFVETLKGIGDLTKAGYYFLYLFILPLAAIPVLKKKLTGKWALLYTYFSGKTFGFAIIGLIGIFA